ncbi:MAG: ABC transporter permease [Atopobiaceae bacterium]|nr:ABC transporter permease [Atopobiaceae bacterium]
MKLRDLAYETSSALLANRARSLLTILGIVIGIAAVIAMTALIDGVKAQLVGQLGLNMSRTVSITCWPPGNQPLDQDDIEEIGQALSSDYESVTGFTQTGVNQASSQTASLEYLGVVACEPEYFSAMGYEAARGRLFNAEEAEEGATVVVLGGSSVKNLFGSPDADCVGQSVRIGSNQYTVIGVVDEGFPYDNDICYLPAETAVTRLIGQGGYSSWQILGFAREGSDMYAVAANTESYLYQRYNIPYPEEGQTSPSSDEGYVYVQTAQALIDQLDATTATFRMLALAVAGISLLVGGIGIMNMMLTNVTERIREIGLRKALGARRGDITGQFLLESVTICIVGGAIGVGVGYGGAWLLASVAGSALGSMLGTGGEIAPVISPATVATATGICVGIGVVFGWYPARRGARMDPVEALRYQ